MARSRYNTVIYNIRQYFVVLECQPVFPLNMNAHTRKKTHRCTSEHVQMYYDDVPLVICNRDLCKKLDHIVLFINDKW